MCIYTLLSPIFRAMIYFCGFLLEREEEARVLHPLGCKLLRILVISLNL